MERMDYMGYTYDEFEKAASAAGLLGNFSSYDLDLARKYPEFGLSVLSLKQDWNNAGTEEQKLLANEMANELRRSYGGYTGGANGGGFYAQGKLAGQIDDTLERIGSFAPFQYGRENEYQAALDAVMNRDPFSYDYAQDPSWQAYKKQYTREGQRALQDAMGQAAAMTGGSPSTAAVAAGQQAQNYYNAQMTDKIPELYQQAYQRYAQEYQDKLNAFRTLLTDRQQAQGEYLSDYDMLRSYLGDLQGQEQADYSRAWNESQAAQEQRQQALENRLALAQLGAKFGDYSGLAELGIDTGDYGDKLYAFGADGGSYTIGSAKGQYFLSSARPGQTMTGADGSLWVKNEDGSVTITTADGKTYTIGGTGGAETRPRQRAAGCRSGPNCLSRAAWGPLRRR